MNFKEEEKIYELIHNLYRELQLPTLAYTDYNRAIIVENKGVEEIVPVKQIYFEAKPNTKTEAIKTLIDTYTKELGWEFLTVEKQAWVNDYIRYNICFKL